MAEKPVLKTYHPHYYVSACVFRSEFIRSIDLTPTPRPFSTTTSAFVSVIGDANNEMLGSKHSTHVFVIVFRSACPWLAIAFLLRLHGQGKHQDYCTSATASKLRTSRDFFSRCGKRKNVINSTENCDYFSILTRFWPN